MTVFMGISSWGLARQGQTLLAPSTGLATRPSVAPPEVSDGAAMVSDACRRNPHRHDRPPRAHNDRDQRPAPVIAATAVPAPIIAAPIIAAPIVAAP